MGKPRTARRHRDRNRVVGCLRTRRHSRGRHADGARDLREPRRNDERRGHATGGDRPRQTGDAVDRTEPGQRLGHEGRRHHQRRHADDPRDAHRHRRRDRRCGHDPQRQHCRRRGPTVGNRRVGGLRRPHDLVARPRRNEDADCDRHRPGRQRVVCLDAAGDHDRHDATSCAHGHFSDYQRHDTGNHGNRRRRRHAHRHGERRHLPCRRRPRPLR